MITKTLTALSLAAAALLLSCTAQADDGPIVTYNTKVVAHRGYWDAPGSAQNSIRSLVKADSIGCFGSEFDVWMTLDSVLVVNHDPDINGVVIQNSYAADVLKQKLSNGENIPTLDQYLTAAEPLDIRLVLELKTHNSRTTENAALDRVLDLVKKHGLENRTDYIAFSREAFANFVKKAPEGASVQYLNGDYIPEQIKQTGGSGIDYYLGTMRKHPEWIKECHDLGLTVNIWTVNSPKDLKWCLENGADIITTNAPELLQKMVKGEKY